MKITLVSDQNSWINEYIPALAETLSGESHELAWVHKVGDIPEGDLAFYLGCGQLVPTQILRRNSHNLVVHESSLPKGRGWSPLTWQILEGKNEIPIVLFEAMEKVDSGKIYIKRTMTFVGNELIDELRKAQGEMSIGMCLEFVRGYPEVIGNGSEQQGEPTYYHRRRPDDSRLDPHKTLQEQFDLLRVVDNERYPAFFELRGRKFLIKIEST